MSAQDSEELLVDAGKQLGLEIAQLTHQRRILRVALEAIYTQPYITLAFARALAGQALEDTE